MGNYFCRRPSLATPFGKSPMQKGERRRRFLKSDQLILDSSAVFRPSFPGQSCRRGKEGLGLKVLLLLPFRRPRECRRECRRVPSCAFFARTGQKESEAGKALFPLPRPPSQPVALLLLSLLPSSVKVRAGANAHTRNPRARFARKSPPGGPGGPGSRRPGLRK